MYAMMREAIHIVEIGAADIETVDRSFRNDIGWWATICGPFRWMDITGLPIYAQVMKGIFPDLCNSAELPKLMQEKVDTGTKFYEYSEGKEKEWENVWTDFTHDIREIVEKYKKRINL
jgi:3-hydroxybutyryl-CoA dehydrogenase